MEKYRREELKRFENMDLTKLVDLWMDLSTPDFDILCVSDSYQEKNYLLVI